MEDSVIPRWARMLVPGAQEIHDRIQREKEREREQQKWEKEQQQREKEEREQQEKERRQREKERQRREKKEKERKQRDKDREYKRRRREWEREQQKTERERSKRCKFPHLTEKLDSLKDKFEALDYETRKSMIDPSKVSKDNSHAQKGLQEVLNLMKQENKLSKTLKVISDETKGLLEVLNLLTQENKLSKISKDTGDEIYDHLEVLHVLVMENELSKSFKDSHLILIPMWEVQDPLDKKNQVLKISKDKSDEMYDDLEVPDVLEQEDELSKLLRFNGNARRRLRHVLNLFEQLSKALKDNSDAIKGLLEVLKVFEKMPEVSEDNSDAIRHLREVLRLLKQEYQLLEVPKDNSDAIRHLLEVLKLLKQETEWSEVSKDKRDAISRLRQVLNLLEEKNQVSKVLKDNNDAIRRLREVLNSIEQEDQAAAASGASAKSRPLKGVRQTKHFTTKVPSDQRTPEIRDVKFLHGRMLLVADSNNSSIKLFNTQGEHVHTLSCRHHPFRLAVLKSQSYRPSASTDVAVTLPHCPAIDILQVDAYQVKKKKTIQTTRRYFAVAVLNDTTLAVGYHRRPGIDLINLSGEILREIRSRERVLYMDVTEDGDLLCCAASNKILRVKVDPVDVVLYKSVAQNPRGLVIAPDGSVLVTYGSKNTLHRFSSQVVWVEQLWSVPSDTDPRDELWRVSLSRDGRECICVSHYGSAYMFDCVDVTVVSKHGCHVEPTV